MQRSLGASDCDTPGIPSAGILAPSILASDFANLESACRTVGEAGAEWIHFDVMDGHFVPNITIGPPVLAALRRVTRLVLDVHLMISEPGRYLGEFLDAGADWLTFHIEAVDDPRPLLDRIHDAGRLGGLALKPGTPVDTVLPFVEFCDMILVMTVEPGFGGQGFLSQPLDKIGPIRARAAAKSRAIAIEVDGGIDFETLPIARDAGANVFVAGSAVYGTPDVAATVRRFNEILKA